MFGLNPNVNLGLEMSPREKVASAQIWGSRGKSPKHEITRPGFMRRTTSIGSQEIVCSRLSRMCAVAQRF